MRILGVLMILTMSLAACRTNPSNLVEVVTEPASSTPAIAAAEITIPPPAPSPSPTWRPFLQTPAAIATTVAPSPEPPTVLPEATTSESTSPTATPTAAVVECVSAAPPGWTTYMVLPGDTVGRLAQCSGAPIAAIAAANCLTGTLPIFAGQALYLPPACHLPTTTPAIATVQASPSGRDETNNGTNIPLGVPPQPGPQGAVNLMPVHPVPPGGLVIISFTNFLADTWLTVRLNPIDADEPPGGKDEYIVRTNTMGNGRMGLLIPLDYPPGEIDLTATTGNITGFVTLTIAGPTATPEPTTSNATDEPPIPNPATMVP